MQRTSNDTRLQGLILVVVAILSLAAGFLVGRWSAPGAVGSEGQQGAPEAVSEEGVGPRALDEGVPVGYSRTEEGALQAALSYSRALGPDPGEGREVYAAKLRAMASSEWGEELESTIDSWSEGEAEVAPLRYRITDFSPNRAEVILWFASFVNPRDGSPGAVWGRAFLTLVWEDGDWKIAAEDGDAGPWPTPLSPASISAELSELVAGFDSIEYEPSSLP